MEKLVLGKILAITGLVGVGVAAPGAVWLAQNPEALDLDRASQAVSTRGGISPGLQLHPPELVVDRTASQVALVQLQPVVIVVPRAAPRAVANPVDQGDGAGGRSCRSQASETFDRGQVRVCDVDRTAVERGVGVFGGIEKRGLQAPRNLSSPSGLLDGS